MIEFVDQGDEALHKERCCVGNHKLSKGIPFRPLVRINKVMMCEAHYNMINQHGLDHYTHRRSAEHLIPEVRARNHREAALAAKEKAVSRARRNQPGFVYYIRIDDLIKIGYARDIAQRMRAYPPSAELLAAHPGTEQLEREIHCDMKAFLRRGREWFEPHERVMERVAEVRMRFGDPSAMAYKYREAQ